MAAGSGRDAEVMVTAEVVDGEGAPSRCREADGEGSADSRRGRHVEADITAAAAHTEERE